MVNNIIGGFFNFCTLVKRLDSEGTYMREMHSDPDICMALATINETLAENEEACERLQKKYEEHSYLWNTDLEQYFKEFCEDAVVITPLGQRIEDLDKFDKAISKYEAVHSQISKLQSPTDVSWLRVNITPIKQALLMWCSKWINTFTQHMKTSLAEKLKNMDKFMTDVKKGLSTDITDGPAGKAALMEVGILHHSK